MQMTHISLFIIFPKIKLPLWPYTVEIGKFGIVLYGIIIFSSMQFSAKSPNPEPKTNANSGFLGSNS